MVLTVGHVIGSVCANCKDEYFEEDLQACKYFEPYLQACKYFEPYLQACKYFQPYF